MFANHGDDRPQAHFLSTAHGLHQSREMRIGHVTQSFARLENPLTGCRGDFGRPTQHAGHGYGGYSCCLGNILKRDGFRTHSVTITPDLRLSGSRKSIPLCIV